MVEQDFSGDFWNELNVKDLDIGTIVSDVLTELKESPNEKEIVNNVVQPKKYKQHSVKVEINGVIKTYKIPQQTGLRLQNAFGKDSVKWLGQYLQFKLRSYKAFGVDKIAVDGFPIAVDQVKL